MKDKPQGDSENCQSSGLLGIKYNLLHSECWGELFGGDKNAVADKKSSTQATGDSSSHKPKTDLGHLVAQVNAQQVDGKDKPDKPGQDKNTGNQPKAADAPKPGDAAVQNSTTKAPEQKPESPNQAELTATANKAGSDTQSGEMASTAKALQAIADDPKLFEKLTGGRNALTKADLERALGELSPLTRSIVWMYFVEGFTHEEIAASFSRSVSFSKTQVSRGTRRLRESLAPTESQVAYG